MHGEFLTAHSLVCRPTLTFGPLTGDKQENGDQHIGFACALLYTGVFLFASIGCVRCVRSFMPLFFADMELIVINAPAFAYESNVPAEKKAEAKQDVNRQLDEAFKKHGQSTDNVSNCLPGPFLLLRCHALVRPT